MQTSCSQSLWASWAGVTKAPDAATWPVGVKKGFLEEGAVCWAWEVE